MGKNVYLVTLHFPQWEFFLLNFILFYGAEGLEGQRADMKGQGKEWDWDACHEIHKGSIRSKQANKIKNLLFPSDLAFWKVDTSYPYSTLRSNRSTVVTICLVGELSAFYTGKVLSRH